MPALRTLPVTPPERVIELKLNFNKAIIIDNILLI